MDAFGFLNDEFNDNISVDWLSPDNDPFNSLPTTQFQQTTLTSNTENGVAETFTDPRVQINPLPSFPGLVDHQATPHTPLFTDGPQQGNNFVNVYSRDDPILASSFFAQLQQVPQTQSRSQPQPQQFQQTQIHQFQTQQFVQQPPFQQYQQIAQTQPQQFQQFSQPQPRQYQQQTHIQQFQPQLFVQQQPQLEDSADDQIIDAEGPFSLTISEPRVMDQQHQQVPFTPYQPLSPPQPQPQPVQAPVQQRSTSPVELVRSVVEANEISQQNLRVLFEKQRMLLLNPSPHLEEADRLRQLLSQLRGDLDNQFSVLRYTNQGALLEPQPLHILYYLQHDISIQIKQIELLQQELQSLSNPNSNQRWAQLVISQQPFPEVVFKEKQLGGDVLQVKLLTGACVEIKSMSSVRADLIIDAQTTKPKNITFSNMEQALDPITRIAKFPILFHSGTRRSPVSLRFSVRVQLQSMVLNGRLFPAPQEFSLETTPSEPFVVITNENQWESTEQVLLKKDALSNSAEVPWIQFCNTLQRHFLRATRQSPAKAERFLSRMDFDFFHQKFFSGHPTIKSGTFDRFWEWFGKTLTAMRYQRFMKELWQAGIIFGFMTRETIHAALAGRQAGTFIVRFSENYAGQCAVAYTGAAGDIKHYLIGIKDVHQKKPLPEFLAECSQFENLLVCVGFSESKPVFKKVPKLDALRSYYNPPEPQQSQPPGYDPLETPWKFSLSMIGTQGPAKRQRTGEKRTIDKIS